MAEIYRDIVSGGMHRIGDRDSDIFIASNATAPTDGTEGTGAGTLGKGSILIAKDTGILYENKGTKTSPTWNAVGEISEAEIANGAVTEDKIGTGAVTETKLGAAAVTEAKLHTSVAGEGLEGGAGDPLSVVVSEGTIVSPVASTLAVGSANAELTLTADVAGVAGDDITIALIDPADINQSLAVVVTGNAIEVSLATDGSGVITSTANDLVTALNGDVDASALITASVESGTGADPMAAVAATPLANGVDGTVGYKGQLLFDATYIYISVDASTVSVSNWKTATLA